MTPQELKAALESFYRDVARPLSAISAFRSGAVPVFRHHNAGAPRSNRKHEIRRMKTWTSTFRFYDLRDGWPMDPATPEQSHPEPDGA